MEKRTERLKYQAVFHTKVESHQLKNKRTEMIYRFTSFNLNYQYSNELRRIILIPRASLMIL